MSDSSSPIHGSVDPAFAAVAEAFGHNFDASDDDPGDLGAALCVFADGRMVVDLWGGFADLARTRPWERDTLVNAYSIGKSMTAFTVLSLVADGSLRLDAPLASVWPEFGSHGKGSITLRDAMAHRATVPGIDRPVGDDEVFDFEAIAAAVADTEPWWQPGTGHGYHVNTLGHVLGEPVRRVTDRSLGTVLRERITGPLDADGWIGVPPSELGRVAEIDFVQNVPAELRPHVGEDRLERMRRAAYFNPQGLSGIGTVNTDRWRLAEVPSTNLTATARGVATVFANMLETRVDGQAPLLPASLVVEAASTASHGHDLVLDRESHFGLGMMLHQDYRPMGLSPSAFGHYGNGGSIGFADPEAQVAVGFVINRPGDRWQVPRTRRVLDALRTVYGR